MSPSAHFAILVFLLLVLVGASVVLIRWVWPIAVVSIVVYLILRFLFGLG